MLTPDMATLEVELKVPCVSDVSISSTGEQLALATRHGSVVAGLAPWKWRIVAPELVQNAFRVSFHRHPGSRNQLAIASGCHITTVDVETDSAQRLSDHLRPVNAIDWSPQVPHLLASCAEDCRFFVWDVRQRLPAQEMLSPASWTAAVRWSPLVESLLATGHEDSVCVWDTRNASQPMSVLAPGQNRVFTVDWSFQTPHKLLSGTCSSLCRGELKVWDLHTRRKVHEVIEISGVPASASFLPSGPILAAIDSEVALFSMHGRKAALEIIGRHTSIVSKADFAQMDGEYRFVSVSQCPSVERDHCLRIWRHQSEDLQTARCPGVSVVGSTDEKLILTPQLGPQPSPTSPIRTTPRAEPPDLNNDEKPILGGLAKQAAQLRSMDCIEEVVSYYESLPDNSKEYQLGMLVSTTNGIRLRIIVAVDPAAGATKQAVAAADGSERERTWGAELGHGLRIAVEWLEEWAGTYDGPLAPGTIDATFRSISLTDLLSGGSCLCSCVEALVRMLNRRDMPPVMEGSVEAPSFRDRAKDDLPFPRTSGVCWSPDGSLLSFRSVNINVPFPRRWSFSDYRRVFNIFCENERRERTLLADENDEHSVAASRLRIDNTVHKVLPTRLARLVEDHWWSIAARWFLFEPLPQQCVGDLCRHNSRAANHMGRADIAEVWQLMAFLADEAHSRVPSWCASPSAAALVRQMIRQLFESQETLTVAMVSSVLRSLRTRAVSPEASEPELEIQSAPPPSCLLSYHTWSHSSMVKLEMHSGRNPPWSAEATLNASPVVSVQEDIAARVAAPSVRANCVAEAFDLIPKDPSTLECVIHSVHAHCDILHRFGEVHASRLLAKLLYDLRDFHTLPLLNVDAKITQERLETEPITPLSFATSIRSNSMRMVPMPVERDSVVEVTCSVCCEKVRSLYLPCFCCDHGFHVACFRRWFTDMETCPVIGCECRCKEQSECPRFVPR